MTDSTLGRFSDDSLRAELATRTTPSGPYTVKEVERALRLLVEDDGWYALEETGHTIELRGQTVPVIPVANYGGEGQGEERWVVFQVGDQLFRKDGYYASHYGTDWDGEFREVKATEKTITVYE